MKILLLNWKDSKHPFAGGAEEFSVNVLERLARRGYEITWFTSSYPGASAESTENGIKYIRRGSYKTVHYYARHYLRSLGGNDKPDVVIDEVNTRPFMPANYFRFKVRVVNWIHQLAREVWFEEVVFPVSLIGRYILEPMWLRGISGHPTIALSASTADDLSRIGFKNVWVVPPALPDTDIGRREGRESPPLLLFIGRLTEGKKVKHALEAFRMIRSKLPCNMAVVGSGPLLRQLQSAFPEVVFHGHVSEDEKRSLLDRATILLVPGTREGWGLVVLEAQVRGVIPVVYDVPGLRDAVGRGKAGVLLARNDFPTMAAEVIRLLADKWAIERASRDCRSWAKTFSYEKSVFLFEQILRGSPSTSLVSEVVSSSGG